MRWVMIYDIVADGLVLLHFAFILFVVFGGFLVLRWRRLIWLHIPAAVWGALIEFAGWICPLTILENLFRTASGDAGYSGGFIENYIVPIVYPEGLTRGEQLAFGVVVVFINFAVYGWLLARRSRNGAEGV